MSILKTTQPNYEIVREDSGDVFQTANGTYLVKVVVLRLLRTYEVEAKKQ